MHITRVLRPALALAILSTAVGGAVYFLRGDLPAEPEAERAGIPPVEARLVRRVDELERRLRSLEESGPMDPAPRRRALGGDATIALEASGGARPLDDRLSEFREELLLEVRELIEAGAGPSLAEVCAQHPSPRTEAWENLRATFERDPQDAKRRIASLSFTEAVRRWGAPTERIHYDEGIEGWRWVIDSPRYRREMIAHVNFREGRAFWLAFPDR